MRFLKDLTLTMTDYPGHIALMAFNNQCNLGCYGCHMHLFIGNDADTISEDEMIAKARVSRGLADSLILSGGEVLSEPDSIKVLRKVRSQWGGDVILNTNGTYPAMLKMCFDENLVDGVFMDVKVPVKDGQYWNHEKFKRVMGVPFDPVLPLAIWTSMILLYRRGNPEKCRFRTVRYPVYDEDDFGSIASTIREFGDKFGKFIPWDLNEFVDFGGFEDGSQTYHHLGRVFVDPSVKVEVQDSSGPDGQASS